MIKHLALWVLLLLPLSSFSYTFGYSNNAALYGNTWPMITQVLGITTQEGMDISGVLYNYKAVKEVDDNFTVTIQNEDVDGGYIFQETDDWSGKHGMRIQKVIPLAYTPIERFGNGSIETTGTGSIEDATVLYMYRWDLCRDPQNDPSCPNYVEPIPKIPDIEIYDALEDEFVVQATEDTNSDLYNEKEEKSEETEKDEEDKERLEIAMAATENALTIANTVSQAVILKSMNTATNINSYYVANIQGGIYRESISLSGGEVVDNRKALKSLGQDKLMNTMIRSQYNNE